ncbi:MAG TPA: septum formation inhibitor Maf, partial [Porphyromonadaceae bacterium]|nr:septum formation inhibitor Maf [Porphyromonadaceae bacterium]
MKSYNLLLASNSLRRRELIAGLGYPCKVVSLPNVDESYPPELKGEKIPLYIAHKKSIAYKKIIQKGEILVTADTVVFLGDRIFEKPKDLKDAFAMIKTLSSKTHVVATGVVLSDGEKEVDFVDTTEVTFASLEDEEIEHYLQIAPPLDKSGSYGIQEWIGYIGIEGIKGSQF